MRVPHQYGYKKQRTAEKSLVGRSIGYVVRKGCIVLGGMTLTLHSGINSGNVVGYSTTVLPVGVSTISKQFISSFNQLGGNIHPADPELANRRLAVECQTEDGRRRFYYRIDEKKVGHWYDEDGSCADTVEIKEGMIRVQNMSSVPLVLTQAGQVPESPVMFTIHRGLGILSHPMPMSFTGDDILNGLSSHEDIDIDFINYSRAGTNLEYAIVSEDDGLKFYQGDLPVPAGEVSIPPGTPIWYWHGSDSEITLCLPPEEEGCPLPERQEVERPINVPLPRFSPDEESKSLSDVNLNLGGALFPKEERTQVAVKIKDISRPIPAVLVSSNTVVKVVKPDGQPIAQKISAVEAIIVREDDRSWMEGVFAVAGKKLIFGKADDYAILPFVWGTLVSIATTSAFELGKHRIKKAVLVFARFIWRLLCIPFRFLGFFFGYFAKIRYRNGHMHIVVGRCSRRYGGKRSVRDCAENNKADAAVDPARRC